MQEKRNFVPEGWPRVATRIVTRDTKGLVEFVKHVFDAGGEHQQMRPSELRIGDSMLLVSDAAERAPMGAFLYVYVEDADAIYRRALDSGARSIEPPAAMPYGDRRAMVEDRWGNVWQIATHQAGRAR